MTTPVVGRSYRIYGAMPGMKRKRPVAGDGFAINLIHAEVFSPSSDEDCAKLTREVEFLNGQGDFELREVD